MHKTPQAKIKAIIFDFDGTIADSFELIVETLQSIIKLPQPLTKGEIEQLRKSSLPEIIKRLGVKKWQIPWLLIRGRNEVGKNMHRVKPFKDIPGVLKTLSEQDYQLYILSTNGKSTIAEFLAKHNLDSFIIDVYANVGLQGKTNAIKKMLKKLSLQTTECIYVGDETRDIEAAQKAGIKCIAIGTGFGDLVTLRSYKPDAAIGTSAELTKALADLEK